MSRATVALLVLLVALPLAAQRRGGITRAPVRGGFIPALGAGAPAMPTGRHMGEPLPPGPVRMPSERRQWTRLDTPHFAIFSSAGPRVTRRIAADLEKLTAVLTHASPYFRAPAMRTRVFLFGDARDAQPYFDAAYGLRVDAAGVTVRHRDGSTILIDCTAKGGTALTPRHELVHDLLRNSARPLPHWIEEGLAEYYSNSGQPILQHVSRLRGPMRIPLEEMFALQYNSPQSSSWDFYAQSWAAVAVLLRRDAAAFHAFLHDVDAGTPQREALRVRFGLTPASFANAIARGAAGAAPAGIMTAVTAPLGDAVPLDRATLLAELGQLLLRLPNRTADAERHFEAAGAR